MDQFALFDKSERQQLILFQVLSKGSMRWLCSDLREKTGFSKKILNERLTELIEVVTEFFPEIELFKTGEVVYLKLESHFNYSNLLYHYVVNSINCQLIHQIYQLGEIDPIRMMNEFFLSESTYYRRIRDINEAIAEFEIKIVNGRFQGEELQIRFFFFNFFWYLFPLTVVAKMNNDPYIVDLMKIIQKQTAITLHFFDYHKLFLWIRITKHRLGYRRRLDSKAIEEFLGYVANHRSYQQTKQIYFRFLSRYTFPWLEEEVLFIYLFLISSFTIPYQSTFFEQIVEDSTQEDTKKLKNYLQGFIGSYYDLDKLNKADMQYVEYILMNLMWGINVFRGRIIYFDEEKVYSLSENTLNAKLVSFAERILELSQNVQQRLINPSESIYKVAVYRIMMLLVFLDKTVRSKFRLGIDYYGDILLRQTNLDSLSDLLKSETYILVEEYQQSKEYDLVITNSSIAIDHYGTESYVFLEVMSQHELGHLIEVIKKIYNEKG